MYRVHGQLSETDYLLRLQSCIRRMTHQVTEGIRFRRDTTQCVVLPVQHSISVALCKLIYALVQQKSCFFILIVTVASKDPKNASLGNLFKTSTSSQYTAALEFAYRRSATGFDQLGS